MSICVCLWGKGVAKVSKSFNLSDVLSLWMALLMKLSPSAVLPLPSDVATQLADMCPREIIAPC